MPAKEMCPPQDLFKYRGYCFGLLSIENVTPRLPWTQTASRNRLLRVWTTLTIMAHWAARVNLHLKMTQDMVCVTENGLVVLFLLNPVATTRFALNVGSIWRPL
jgi:hypothetical protein